MLQGREVHLYQGLVLTPAQPSEPEVSVKARAYLVQLGTPSRLLLCGRVISVRWPRLMIVGIFAVGQTG